MREMKDSGIEWVGQVPIDWKVRPIRADFGEITEKNKFGKVKKALKFTYGRIIPKEDFDADDDDYVADTILNYTIVSPDTIMLNCLNLNFDFVSQRIGLVTEKGVITSAYMAFKATNSDVIPQYATYLFKSYDNCKAFHNMGGGVRKILNFSEFKKKYYLLPTLTEQRAIVEHLDKECFEIETLISDIQKQIATLEQYKRSVITEAVTKGLDPNVEMKDSGVDYLGKMNAKWKLTKLRYICEKLNRYFKSDAEPLICSNKGEVFPRGDNSVGLVSDNDKMFQGVHKGDLLIHGMDTWHGAIAVSDYDGKCTTVVHVCDSDQNKYFICYFLQMLAIKSVYKAISNGVRENTSDFRSWDKAGHIYITLPPLDEQNRIAEYIKDKIEHINSIIAEKTQQITAIEEYKKSLIFEYVTGKKEVQA